MGCNPHAAALPNLSNRHSASPARSAGSRQRIFVTIPKANPIIFAPFPKQIPLSLSPSLRQTPFPAPHVRHEPRADSIPKGSGERIRAAVLSLGPAPKAASLPRAPTPSTAPVCCPQCQQGDGVVVCMKLAKVRAAVRGAGCVNAIF